MRYHVLWFYCFLQGLAAAGICQTLTHPVPLYKNFTKSAVDVRLSDVNNDDFMDIIVRANKEFFLFLNENGSFPRYFDQSVVPIPIEINSLDYWNIDVSLSHNILRIFAASRHYQKVQIAEIDTTTYSVTSYTLDLPASNGVSAIFEMSRTQDDSLDFLVIGYQDGHFLARIDLSLRNLAKIPIAIGNPVTSAYVADWDGDGMLDILYSSINNTSNCQSNPDCFDGIYFIRALENGSFDEAILIDQVTADQIIATDLDSNGLPDIVLLDGEYTIHYEKDSLTSSLGVPRQTFHTGTVWPGKISLNLSDMDFDGDMDININGISSWLRNDLVTSNTLAQFLLSEGRTQELIYLEDLIRADFDNDSNIDSLVRSSPAWGGRQNLLFFSNRSMGFLAENISDVLIDGYIPQAKIENGLAYITNDEYLDFYEKYSNIVYVYQNRGGEITQSSELFIGSEISSVEQEIELTWAESNRVQYAEIDYDSDGVLDRLSVLFQDDCWSRDAKFEPYAKIRAPQVPCISLLTAKMETDPGKPAHDVKFFNNWSFYHGPNSVGFAILGDVNGDRYPEIYIPPYYNSMSSNLYQYDSFTQLIEPLEHVLDNEFKILYFSDINKDLSKDIIAVSNGVSDYYYYIEGRRVLQDTGVVLIR